MTTAALMLFSLKRWFTEATLIPSECSGVTQWALSAILTILAGSLQSKECGCFCQSRVTGLERQHPHMQSTAPVERSLSDTGVPETVGATSVL